MIFNRRTLLKGGAAASALLMAERTGLLGRAQAWAAEARFKPENGASLRLLRWKRFIQSEEDQFMANVAAYTKATGVSVQVDNEFMDDIQPKASVAANVGEGPDMFWGLYSTPHLFPEKLLDLSDVADHLGSQNGGWVDTAQVYGQNGGKWIGLPMCFNGNYINYRKSAVEKAGFSQFPTDLNGFLELCKALKGVGMPAGMALGKASGDGNAWVHWALWSHGAAMVDANDKVTLDSAATLAAVSYVKKLYDAFIPGTASWNDGSNNKAFLAGQLGLTNNGISIYQKAVVDKMDMADDIDHAFWPIGPAGKPTEFHIAYPIFAFQYTKFPNACKSFMEYMMSSPAHDDWLNQSFGYLTQALNKYESLPVWTSDPKRTIFKDAAKRTLTAGYKGTVGQKAAAALADFIVLDMFAEAATGKRSAQDAVRAAARKAQRIYRRG